VALTNFDTERLQIILENEIPVVSNQVNPLALIFLSFLIILYTSGTLVVSSMSQVQHSLVDMRPQQRMAELCRHTGVKLITSLSFLEDKEFSA